MKLRFQLNVELTEATLSEWENRFGQTASPSNAVRSEIESWLGDLVTQELLLADFDLIELEE